LSSKLRKHHKTDKTEKTNKTDNTSKINCTSSVYGFMRQVRRMSNPKKKTFIYIPYASLHCNQSVYNPNCKTA